MVSIREPAKNIMKKIAEKKITFPIVLKPIKGTFGIDVVANIENNFELHEALVKLKTKPYFYMMCEEFVPGDVYRVFVFNGQVIDIIKREQPFIIGDGSLSVDDLIKGKNKEQVRKGLFPTENIAYPYIKKQGYGQNDVVGNYHKVYTSNVINAHNGARIARMNTSNIPSKNIDLFIKVGEVMGIKCYGLDYISKDINQPYDQGHNVILEVNGTPDTELHVTDGNGQKFFDKIVKRIF
jgi:cyanophycin synthetase